MKLLFAGDWHGDEGWAEEVLVTAATRGVDWVVQVGDFGFGFFRLGDDPNEPGDWAPRCPFARHVSALAVEAGVSTATRPRLVVHGHWHHRYTAERNGGRVEGIASNLEHDKRSFMILDLATLA